MWPSSVFTTFIFTPCEFEKCAFPSKMNFCKFYHSIGIDNFCLSRELSRHLLCWRQQDNFHIKCPLFTNALYHLRVPAIVGNFLITVFAIDFPVRIHVYVQISTPLTYLFAQLTNQLTFIMIWLNVQPQILVSLIFKVAYDAGRHCQCQVKPECSIKYGNISVPKWNF